MFLFIIRVRCCMNNKSVLHLNDGHTRRALIHAGAGDLFPGPPRPACCALAARPVVVSAALAAVHRTPSPLLHPPPLPQEHLARTPRIRPRRPIPSHLRSTRPPHPLLSPRTPTPRPVPLPLPRQHPPIRLRPDPQVGQPPLHAPRGHKHTPRHPGRRPCRQRVGRRGGQGRGFGVEDRRCPRSSRTRLLCRSRRCHQGVPVFKQNKIYIYITYAQIKKNPCRHSPACPSLPFCSAPPSPPSSSSPSSASPSNAQTSSKQVLFLSTSSTLPGFPV